MPQNEEIGRGGKNEGGEGIGSAICQRGVNTGSIDNKKRARKSYLVRC